MALLLPVPPTVGKTKRSLHAALHIDMTPLVDLAFLLITFFIVTTTMSAKKADTLIVPKNGSPMNLAASKALTVLLEKGKVWVYKGDWNKALEQQQIKQVSYSENKGLGKTIRDKQKQLGTEKDKLTLVIKPLNTATYQNVIDALDEVMINNVTRYALVDASKDEAKYVER